jgi:hypothetical protein
MSLARGVVALDALLDELDREATGAMGITSRSQIGRRRGSQPAVPKSRIRPAYVRFCGSRGGQPPRLPERRFPEVLTRPERRPTAPVRRTVSRSAEIQRGSMGCWRPGWSVRTHRGRCLSSRSWVPVDHPTGCGGGVRRVARSRAMSGGRRWRRGSATGSPPQVADRGG